MILQNDANLTHLIKAANLYIEKTQIYVISMDDYTNYAASYLTTELLPLIITHMEHLFRNRTLLQTDVTNWPYYLVPNNETVCGYAVARVPDIDEPDIGVLSLLFRRTLETDLFTIQDSPRSFVATPYMLTLMPDGIDDEEELAGERDYA